MQKNYLVDLISQSVEDGVIFIDNKLIVNIFNPAATRYSGITASEALGKLLTNVLTFKKNEQKTVFELIDETLSGHGTSLYHQAILECEEGIYLPIVYRLIAVADENDRPYGCLLVFKDYKTDHYKTDFLSLVAHQLKTPLGSMRWNLESLLASSYIQEDTKIAEVVGDVYDCNSRLISLVDDLLNASRIDAKKVVNKPEEINILSIVEGVIKELAYQINQKKLSINVGCGTDLKIIVDPKHFREVVSNLLSNAIKYNRENGTVDIMSTRTNDEVVIAIGDTGIGIPDSELPKIFSKSFRAKNAIETQIDGSGLGLYVAKSFIEDWGGKINCRSAIGQGTTFEFTVPFQTTKSSLDKNLSI